MKKGVLLYQEKKILEVLLQMQGGYVLDFTNNDFKRFVFDSVGVDIYDGQYAIYGDSKANRLRSLWDVSSNKVVSKLLTDLINYRKDFFLNDDYLNLEVQANYQKCLSIISRLNLANENDFDFSEINCDDDDLEKLGKILSNEVSLEEPQTQLDRLHTFLGKFVRKLCDKHGLSHDASQPLNSLYGKYIKHLQSESLLESEMSVLILRTTISVLEKFNDVRNNKSYAHPNPLLNYNEALLIFNYCKSLVRFIDALEIKLEADKNCKRSRLTIV